MAKRPRWIPVPEITSTERLEMERAQKRRAFFDTLVETCRIEDAFAASGLQAQDLHALDEEEFTQSWRAALRRAYQLLELEMLARARFGNADPKMFNDAHGLRMIAQFRAHDGYGPSPSVIGGVPTERLQCITSQIAGAVQDIEQALGDD